MTHLRYAQASPEDQREALLAIVARWAGEAGHEVSLCGHIAQAARRAGEQIRAAQG